MEWLCEGGRHHGFAQVLYHRECKRYANDAALEPNIGISDNRDLLSPCAEVEGEQGFEDGDSAEFKIFRG